MAAWEAIPGLVLSNEVIPVRAGWSRTLSGGQVLRLEGLEGRQAADFPCCSAADQEDRYAAADTMKINGNIFIRKGTVLYSVDCNPMFTVVEDSVSNCPQMNNPVNDFNPTPVRATVYQP
jgi:uncharacterized protein YcgI (DUF1989 family)